MLNAPSIVRRMRMPHAVVIGSGFGGLAAAVRLAARGYRVTVLERLDRPGGRARVFRQGGYTFDCGPTIITAPHLFEELWALAGRKLSDDVDLRPLAHWYRINFHDGGHYDCVADEMAQRAEVARIAPADIAGFDRFMKHSEKIFRTGFEELADAPFHKLSFMAKVAPQLALLRGDRSVHATVAKFVKHPYLRFALSFHPLFVGGNPFAASAVYCLISHLERKWGVHHAVGGTGALVRGLCGLIENAGDEIRYGAEVDEILVDEGMATGVRLVSGETIAADIVVSNADTAFTYRRLLRNTQRKRWTDRALERARYSMSLFVWYFGTKTRYEAVPHHTIALGPRYRGHIDEIFRGRGLPGDFSLYLHRPTASDPSLAPPGCDTFYVLSPVPHLDAGTDWQTAAEAYRAKIARRLSETLLPGLEDNLAVSRVFTPQHFHDCLLSTKGAGFGMEPLLSQSAWFRPHNRSEDVRHLYLVGAGTHPGAGVPGVLSSAKILDAIVPEPAAFV